MAAPATDDPDFEVEKDPSGRYVRFNEVLGQGAFKTVYKAFDEIAGLEVAWNRVNIEDVLQQEPDKLYAEIHLLKSLKHDNIIKLYDFWVDEKSKTINMITELFTSGCLRQYRKKHRVVDMKAIKNWARQILRGLHYLHSHKPPIIHRDLKCENIFVNGNTGEIKIGDLGLAIVIEQATTRSVAGTPAFMAPELYDEDYNELVDVYSFGMCLLEMVTCEFPYRECLNSAQIYKKVISGVKPNSLSRVTDPKVKDFIEKCLVPAASRLPAIELLNDPFLAWENPKNPTCEPLQKLPNIVSKFMDMKVSIGSCETPISSSFEELRKSSANYEFRLRGKKVDENHVLFTLRVVKACGSGKGREQKIEFRFYLGSDSSTSIANEMVEELKFSKEDVSVAAELIDSLISRIVPLQNTLCRNSSRGTNTNANASAEASKQHVVHSIKSIRSNLSAKHGIISKTSGSSGCTTLDMTCSKGPKGPNGFSISSDFGAKAKSCDANKQHALHSQLPNARAQDSIESIMSNLSAKHGIISKGSGSSGCTTLDMISSKGPKGLNGYSVSSDFGEKAKSCGGDNVNESVVKINDCSKNTDLDELKPELDYIDAQYNQCIHELLKMKEEAIENAKKRWMSKKSSPVSS